MPSANGHTHGFVSVAAEELGTLGPYDVGSMATGINDAGQVVGTDTDANGNWHGFVSVDGVMMDMWTVFPANSGLYPMMANIVNSSGQVSGMMLDAATSEVDAFFGDSDERVRPGTCPLSSGSRCRETCAP